MTDEHDETTLVVATPSMACDHDWAVKWRHEASGRTVEDCGKCNARRFKDDGRYTLGEVAPWVSEEHRRAFDAATKPKA
jgi:hypothetical protein